MVVLLQLCAALLFISINVHCIPILSTCQPEIIPTTATIVGTTIVDNSVSNALANALQLLIVSNLIENTMTVPGPCGLNALQAIAPICESISIPTPTYPPALDVIVPEYVPSIPYNPIPPYEFLSPRETVVDFIPNVYYQDILPNPGCNCGYETYIPECGCNIGPNYGPNIGCNNCGYGNLVPNVVSVLPNTCGCNNYAYEPYTYVSEKCAPIVSEMVFPAPIPAPVSYNYGYGLPNFPLGVTLDPWGYY